VIVYRILKVLSFMSLKSKFKISNSSECQDNKNSYITTKTIKEALGLLLHLLIVSLLKMGLVRIEEHKQIEKRRKNKRKQDNQK
jgi:uncharacterized membrane protein YidH (DUF202 family)